MNLLAAKIAKEIQQTGPMPFARFMERALYEPELGYYEQQREIGRKGDFYTSVSVGSLFGELMAFQFAEWVEELPIADCGLRIVEAGAHDGQLAKDILNWLLEFRGGIFKRTAYTILEPSMKRREWQKESLKEFAQTVQWFDSLNFANSKSAVDHSPFTIVFSNELLDAMPVHRLRWDAAAKSWREWLVNYENNGFCWGIGEVQNELKKHLPRVPAELAEFLPDGFTTEISPAATGWWNEAARNLDHGKLLAIDYGFVADEFLRPERGRGTLRVFSRHHSNDDLLASPGEQDITAHVNFSMLQAVGEADGLVTHGLFSQEKFLARIAEQTWKHPEKFGQWTSQRVKQFQTLTHPEHLGRPFRVLIQSRV